MTKTTEPVQPVAWPDERWADICDDDDAVIACRDRWKALADRYGCTVYGFDDGLHASFFTPDGNLIEVGPKFRDALLTHPAPSPDVAGLVERDTVCAGDKPYTNGIRDLAEMPHVSEQLGNVFRDCARIIDERNDRIEALEAEVERLASFIMHCIEGEPSQSQGAVDTAIRIMTEQATTIGEQLTENERLREALFELQNQDIGRLHDLLNQALLLMRDDDTELPGSDHWIWALDTIAALGGKK